MQKKYFIALISLMAPFVIFAQHADSLDIYKKKVLENAEVNYLMSIYGQEGDNSAVGGGVGTEKLSNITPTIVISIPINDDDVLTIDAGISSYTSASSSNINPFNGNTSASTSGATGDDDHEDDDDDNEYGTAVSSHSGTPWLASTGASRSDDLISFHADYKHSSDDRNFIWGASFSLSDEYDYNSFGFGGSVSKLFNEKNTEVGFKGTVYLDKWHPIYPTELHEFNLYGDNFLHQGYFTGIDVINENGIASDGYIPSDFSAFLNHSRNSYSVSFFFSQILAPRMQVAFFSDLVKQEGLLSTPYHRIYFKDIPNYYIGEPEYIPVYTTSQNKGVFQLADDVERLPSNRFKVPLGTRLNFYINETFVVRTYYRYYLDSWGLRSHTLSMDLPIRFGPRFSLTPSYRFYSQNAVKYYAPYEANLSSQEYYTSDPDLARFRSGQYSLAVNYNDIFNGFKISRLGLKNVNLRYSFYSRTDGLSANIISLGVKFVFL
jgi:hypothetical protein